MTVMITSVIANVTPMEEGKVVKARRALVSAFDTTGLAEFVEGLQNLGIEVVGTSANAKYLRESGLSIRTVEQMIGSEAMVGVGAVKTMHPELGQALMWTPVGGDGDNGAYAGGGIGTQSGAGAGDIHGFDIVVVNLEPFERVSSKRGVRETSVIDAIDIDGPSILRSAAKNFANVLVVADPEVYPLVLEELDRTGGDPSWEVRKLLASRAFDATAHYELAVANWFSEVEDFPTYMLRDYVKMIDLPYGENPHQRAAYYVEVGARRHLLSMVDQVQGEEVSFNNLGDLNTARQVTSSFTIPTCTIIKHGAPAGVAVSGDISGAFKRAFACDSESMLGGVIAVNRQVDATTAREIVTNMFEVVFAPDYTEEALKIFAAERPHLRVLIDRERRKKSPGERDMRRVIGGLLVQDVDNEHEEREFMDVATLAQPDERQWGNMLFAWRVARWVPSNAIVLARDLETVGIGGGTPSRHDSIEFALGKAGDRAKGAVLASDAFLGYDDTVQLAIEAGIAGIIQPGGSRRDDEIVAMCNDAGIPMVFTHRRHFRH